MKKFLFDCGANNGCSVRKFATKTLEDFEAYEVHCFEPGAVGESEEMSNTVEKYQNVSLYKKAVSDVNSEITFYDHESYSGASTTWVPKAEDKRRRGDCGSSVKGNVTKKTVECIDLSQFINEKVGDTPDTFVILKLDIEGEEYRVIPKMLENNTFEKIDKIYLEWHPEWNNTPRSSAQLVEKIKEQNPNIVIDATWNALGY